jgi:hypothetical protein
VFPLSKVGQQEQQQEYVASSGGQLGAGTDSTALEGLPGFNPPRASVPYRALPRSLLDVLVYLSRRARRIHEAAR